MFKIRKPLFDMEGAIGAASSAAPDASAAPSVAAGEQSTPDAGNASASTQTSNTDAGAASTTTPDVTHQESFATRLKEERGKIETEYAPYKQRASDVERIAKAAGFKDAGEYLAALDAHVQAEVAAAEAQRLGVDQETYNKFFAPVHDELAKTKQQLETFRQSDLQRQIRAEYDRMKTTYDDFESVQEKVFDLAEQKGYSLEEAYKLVAFDDRVNAAKLAGQAEAIQKLKANSQAATGAAGGDTPDQNFDFTKLTREQRAQYYEKAKRGELKSLR